MTFWGVFATYPFSGWYFSDCSSILHLKWNIELKRGLKLNFNFVSHFSGQRLNAQLNAELAVFGNN